MLTVGQAINEFIYSLEQQGQSQKNITKLCSILSKQFLWEVFSLIPPIDFPAGYFPVKVQAGKLPETIKIYKQYWEMYHHFLNTSSVKYLTMGDAVTVFLNSLTETGYSSRTCLIFQSCIKLLGREYAADIPLTDIDGRITMTILQLNKHRKVYVRRVFSRFMRYLQEQGHLSCKLYQRYELKWKQEIKELISSKQSDLSPNSLFNECLGPFFRYCIDARNLTEHGLKGIYHKLKFFSQWLGPVTVGSLDIDCVEKFLIYLQEERKNGVAAVKSAAGTLKLFCSFLAEEGILPSNPLAQLRVKQPQAYSRTVLTSHEVTMLLSAVRQFDQKSCSGCTKRIKQFLYARNVAIMEILIHTGIRISELRELTINRVNLKRGYIDIPGKGSNHYYKKERRVYIEFDQTRQALTEYLAVRPIEFDPLMFTTKNGNPLSTSDLSIILSRCIKAAGISKHITCHDLRATFASLLTAGGADPLTLKVLMGHENLRTTLKSYVSLDQEQLREVWKKCNPLAHLPSFKGGAE